jgi:hypothetical protein
VSGVPLADLWLLFSEAKTQIRKGAHLSQDNKGTVKSEKAAVDTYINMRPGPYASY